MNTTSQIHYTQTADSRKESSTPPPSRLRRSSSRTQAGAVGKDKSVDKNQSRHGQLTYHAAHASTKAAAIVIIRGASHKLLGRKRVEEASGDSDVRLDHSGRCKSPAATTVALILDCTDDARGPPVHRLREGSGCEEGFHTRVFEHTSRVLQIELSCGSPHRRQELIRQGVHTLRVCVHNMD